MKTYEIVWTDDSAKHVDADNITWNNRGEYTFWVDNEMVFILTDSAKYIRVIPS